MKVLHLSTKSRGGGAARATARLHRALLDEGVDSQMFVAEGAGEAEGVVGGTGTIMPRLRTLADQAPLRLYPHRDRRPFSTNLLPAMSFREIRRLDPDLVHLHWVHGGFLDLGAFRRFEGPVVWTMHDMWPMTGGCHYTSGCDGYLDRCGSCPALGSSTPNDLSRLIWKIKSRAYRSVDLTLVAPSRWMAKSANRSRLLSARPVHVIPNTIDTEIFRPLDRSFARSALRLPQDLRLVLFGAIGSTSDRRKGFAELRAVCRLLAERRSDIGVVVFGGRDEELDLGLPTFGLGHLTDDTSLVLAYAAADVFACPSRQDNLPNTVLEALACGRPCVAFELGGIPDMIRHRENGFLASPFSTERFAEGIEWTLDEDRSAALADAARRTIDDGFAPRQVAHAHIDLYRALIERSCAAKMSHG